MNNTKISEIKRETHEVDVANQILGRVATKIANLLVGKQKPNFVRHLDCGDFVVIKNAALVKVTGKKEMQKMYDRYSGYPGGLKQKSLRLVRKENPTLIMKEAVSGMLPNNKLRADWMARLSFI